MATSTQEAAALPTQTDIASIHAQLLADQSIQFSMASPKPPVPPAWLRPLLELLERLGPFLVYIFWAAVIAGAAIILLLILQEVTGARWRLPWQRRAAETAIADDLAPDQAAARALLTDAEALAERGDYDAAVHLLLQRSVEDIVERMPGFVRPSLTARDIAAAQSLPERARSTFGTIAMVVEAALFARRPVGLAGWTRARDAYADFALRGSWAGSGAPR